MAADLNPRRPVLAYFGAGASILALAAAIELAMGRKIWGISGQPGVWSGDVNSEHNSQYLTDPYSFSHLTHGILLYGLLWMVARKLPRGARALIAIALEAGWEVLENSNLVIERYRTATISLHYYGDSVMNSIMRHPHLHAGLYARCDPACPRDDRHEPS